MKRSPLKRRTPLKRGRITLKKSKLAQVSKQKGKYLQRYYEKITQDKPRPCQRCKAAPSTERHHYRGRVKDRILDYVMLCSACHTWIHDHAQEAYAQGWLHPEFRGMPASPSHPKPWTC